MASTIPVISKATPKIISPTLGWNTSQHAATANKNRGMQTIRAAMKIANPTTLERTPPSKGTYPSKVVIGLKKAQIEITIRKYAPNRIKFFLREIFFCSFWIIS